MRDKHFLAMPNHGASAIALSICLVFIIAPLAEASPNDYSHYVGDYQHSYNYNDYNYGYDYRRYDYNRATCAMTLTYGARTNNYYHSYLDEPATLSWSSSYANSGYIAPDVGSVGRSGARVVYPHGNQTYTMRVSGPWGEGNCQVTAVHPYASIYNNYNSYYPYNYNYVQPYNYTNFYRSGAYVQPYNYGYNVGAYAYTAPVASYVALKSTPYTGADFGPIGNALVWVFIVLLGAIGAAVVAIQNRTLRKVLLRL